MSSNPQGERAMRWSIAFGVIDTLAVMLRFIVRKNRTKIGADDWMIMASLVPAYSMIASARIWITKGGAGKHEADLTAPEMSLLLKYLIPVMIMYGLTITAVKLSILLLYQRVFDTVNFKRAILVVGFLCITWLCGNVFTEIFLCSPMSAAWDPILIFSNHCRDLQAFLVGITASNLLLDLIILCMPLPKVWNLNLSNYKKLEVSGIFLLGSFTCIASLMRLLSVGNIWDKDFSYTILNTYLWSHIECATAIYCACLMTYQPLFADIGSTLSSVFSGGKQTPSKKESLLNSKEYNSSIGSDSEASLSPGRNLRGHESTGYRDLSANGAKENLHVVNHSMEPSRPDTHSSLPPEEYECTRIAVGREASLV